MTGGKKKIGTVRKTKKMCVVRLLFVCGGAADTVWNRMIPLQPVLQYLFYTFFPVFQFLINISAYIIVLVLVSFVGHHNHCRNK